MGDFNISNIQSINRVLYKEFLNLMSSKEFQFIIDRPTHDKNGILDLLFLPFDYVIDNATIFGPD